MICKLLGNLVLFHLDKLAGTSEATQGDGYVREADPTYSTESFAEDFRRDAGSSRKNDAETQET